MKRCCFVLATMVLLVGTGNASAATVVNIDFGPTPNHPNGATSVLYSGTAAAPDAGTTWNEVKVLDDNAFTGPPGEFGFWHSSVSVPNLLNSQGAPTTIGVTTVGSAGNDTGTFGVLAGTTNLQCVATNAVNLMRDYLIGFNSTQHVVLDGFFPGSTVDLYLYGAGDTDNRDTLFSVSDINGLHSATTTGTVSGDGGFPVAHVLTLGGDYVVLPGIKADGTGKIDIGYLHGAGSGEAPFNGLQAVVTAVPEPTSMVLLVLGSLMMVGRLKK